MEVDVYIQYLCGCAALLQAGGRRGAPLCALGGSGHVTAGGGS